MKFTKITILFIINLLLFCTVAFAGNIINEGLFSKHDDVIYYSEQDDGGKLYAKQGDSKTKLSNLNAKYINVYDDKVYFCSTDQTGEYASISYYDIKNGRTVSLYSVEMVKGIKNLYIQNGTAYFQSQGRIYSFSLDDAEVKEVLRDGEIVNFIPMESGFLYTKISGNDTPLYYNNGKARKIANDAVSFELSGKDIYYSDQDSLYQYFLSGGYSKKLTDKSLTNLIAHDDIIYGKGDDEYTIYKYNTLTKKLAETDNGIYSFFNVVDGKVMSVYYSGELLSKTLINEFASSSLISYLPDVGSYKSWKQYDPRWANIKFPNGETIRQVGCLVTSISILIVGSGLRNEASFDPGTFVEALKNNNGFSGASLYWSAVERVVPEFKVYSYWTSLSGTKKEKTATIAKHLDAGRKVVIRAVSNQHWVAADRVEGDKVYICDPGRNVTELYSYYDVSDITRIAVFHPISSDAVKYESGLYSITSDNGLRLRSGPGLSYDRLDLIPFETVIQVRDVGDEWGYTSYKGAEGWVFMEYTKYIGPLTYNISYNANGGSASPKSQEKTHDMPLTLQQNLPQRSGYLFMGWSTDPNAEIASYMPGDIYSANSDAVLYAVWKKSPGQSIYGDVDLDGNFTILDILFVINHISDPQNYRLTKEMFSAADVNKDNKIDSADIELMTIKLSVE